MNRRTYICVDPGKKGAISIREKNNSIATMVIPQTKGKVDIRDLAAMFQVFLEYPDPMIVLEEVHSVYGTSADSNFQFGRVVGMLEALSFNLGVPVEYVQPKSWQKAVWVNNDKVFKPMKPDAKRKTPIIDTKATSLICCKRLFPEQNLLATSRSSVAHDGIVDALLISEWAVRSNI